jgi:hypothetical protein
MKGKKHKDEKDEGNEFGMALKSARDKGEKTFVVSGKKYNVTEADDFKPHMMYDPKTGKGYKANTMDDHLRMKKMGYDHEAPKKEEVERKTFSQKVIESISEFGVESLLAEDNVDVLRSIVKRKSAKPIKFKDGSMTIDMQTANMMLTVLDKVKPANQKKLTAMMNGKKSEFMKVHGFVMKALGK